MKKITLRTLIFTIGLMISSTGLQAMELSHQDVDLNADGKVTESEIFAVIKSHFLMMDRDSNSELTIDEWEPDN